MNYSGVGDHSIVLMFSNSEALATLTNQGQESRAESSAAFTRLEQAALTLQQGVHAHLVSNETVKEMVARNHTQLQDILCQVKQLVQNTSTSRSTNALGIIGELNDDGSMSTDDEGSATANQDEANKLDAHLLESIERLGRLVHEKERTFGDDDDDVVYDTIIQSVGSLLGAAKRYAADTAQDTLSRAIARFAKRHGSHGVILNSQGMKSTQAWSGSGLTKMPDQATSRQSKRKSGALERDLMYHEIPLTTGSLMFKRRRTTLMEPSDGDWTGEGRHKECLTTAAFMPNNTRNGCMIIASEYVLQHSKRQGVLSMSYLSINPVLSTSSRVFQVVKHGNVQELLEMLQKGEASLRDTDVYGNSLLHVS